MELLRYRQCINGNSKFDLYAGNEWRGSQRSRAFPANFGSRKEKERVEQYIAIGVVSQLENISVVKNEENTEASIDELIDKTITVLKTDYLE